MDERYFVYADDVDFMYRALRSGVKLVYLHDAKLLHKVGYLTGGEDSAFSTFYGTRNRIFFLLKHFGVLPTLPWLVVRQAQWLSKLATGKKDRAWYRRKNDALVKAFRMDRSPQFDTTRPGDTQPSNTQPRSNP
jgi:GT2 family glycosyltransferase